MKKRCLEIVIIIVFSTASYLSEAALVTHYQAENNAMDSAGLNDGIIHNVNYVDGKLGQAFDFNGANSYVQVVDGPVLDIDFPLSIATWIRPENSGAADGTTGILWKGDSIGSVTGQSYALLWSVDSVTFRLSDGIALYGTCCALAPLNSFSHIAGTFDGAEIKLYLNGNLVSTSTTVPISINNSSKDLLIGSSGETGSPTRFFFNGQVDDVRIYNHVLTELEIFKLANDTVFNDSFE